MDALEIIIEEILNVSHVLEKRNEDVLTRIEEMFFWYYFFFLTSQPENTWLTT